jgi:hypothetical protein
MSDYLAELTTQAHRLLEAATHNDAGRVRSVRDEAWAAIEAFEGDGSLIDEMRYQGACLIHRYAIDWLDKGRPIDWEGLWGELVLTVPGIVRPRPPHLTDPYPLTRLLLWTVTSEAYDPVLLYDVVELATAAQEHLGWIHRNGEEAELAKQRVLWSIVMMAADGRLRVTDDDLESWAQSQRAWYEEATKSGAGDA